MRKKANNQYYSNYLEEKTTYLLYNNYKEREVSFSFSEEELLELNEEALNISNFIKKHFDVLKAERIGNHTGIENGDILINNNIILELKSVEKAGSGTYFNTSLNSISNLLNIKPYNEFLKENDYYTNLKKITNILFREETSSPFLVEDYKKLSNDEKKQISRLESPIRSKYVNLIYEAMINKNMEEDIAKYYLNKGRKNNIPDYIIISNRSKKKVRILSKEELSNLEFSDIVKRQKSIIFKGMFRMNFGWQNGNGICNPTIRVFLEG